MIIGSTHKPHPSQFNAQLINHGESGDPDVKINTRPFLVQKDNDNIMDDRCIHVYKCTLRAITEHVMVCNYCT